MLSSLYRFHGRRSLAFLFRQGKTVRRKMISLKFVHNTRRQEPRIAVVVGKKVSKSAPVRNRIRRRLYEIVRLHVDQIAPGTDMAFFVYDKEVATLPPAELQAIVIGLLREGFLIE